ncbi:MAG: NADH-quinone oxidoreductase subunit J [Anaerolineales bacterium]|nr:NADH-quinone oxidoreductase subunit J [Anaerolineales bacterium]
MASDLVLFFFLAVIAIATAASVILSRNAVYSAVFLVLNLATVAFFYILLYASFIAMIQLAVYAGAIVVLFLFVIMLLGADRGESGGTLPWQRPLAIGLGVLLVGLLFYLFVAAGPFPAPAASDLPPGFGGPEAVGSLLFADYVIPLEVTSVLLLAAMVGAVVLTRAERKEK